MALVAGGLATLNPCAFPLLPAFVSFYAGASADQLPRAGSRVAQGLVVGLLVTAGFLGVFTVVGLPLVYGATAIADAVPWVGMGLGVVLVALGVRTLAGRRVALALPVALTPGGNRRAHTVVLFGVGYGLSSLGCTLPAFLALLGAAVGAGPQASGVPVFVAYGAGMAVVLMALSVTVALVRDGLTRRLKRLLPYTTRAAGALLCVAGAYLTYYWARIHLGSSATLASDPLVGLVTRFTSQLESRAAGSGQLVVGLAGMLVATALAIGVWQRVRRSGSMTGR